MKRLSRMTIAVGLLAAAACADQAVTPTETNPGGQADVGEFATPGSHVHVMPTRAQYVAGFAKGAAGGGGGTGIFYHNGPVLHATKVVAIYWSASGTPMYQNGPASGTGAGSADGSLIGTFLRGLGGSSYWAVNTTYSDGSGSVGQSVGYTGYWVNTTDPGSKPTDAQIQSMVTGGFSSGKIAYGPETIYLVFTGPGVNLGGGFGSQYCAYHGHFSSSYGDVKYAAQPYNADYPSGCTAGQSPNGDVAADAEVNTLAHEIEEAASDPDLNAWFDRRGYENADKCAWDFGTTSGPTGARWNISVGGKNFLVQQNWINSGSGGCRLSS